MDVFTHATFDSLAEHSWLHVKEHRDFLIYVCDMLY